MPQIQKDNVSIFKVRIISKYAKDLSAQEAHEVEERLMAAYDILLSEK